MREIVYIAPSDNYALHHIRKLREQLAEKEVKADEVNMRRMIVRIGKTYVRFLSITSCELWYCKNFVKYYANGIKAHEFFSREQCEDAIEMTNRLIQSFPQDAKEISEEELIRILKEG